MNLRALFLVVLAFSIASFKVGQTQAWVRYVFDFDGTLVNDSGPKAAWRTDWILVRADHLRHSALQASPVQEIQRSWNGQTLHLFLPSQIAVSYQDFRRIQGYLARDGVWGNIHQPIQLTPDPLRPFHPRSNPEWILPGYYMIVPEVTFSRYQNLGTPHRAADSGLYPISEDFHEALKRSSSFGDLNAWQGSAWPTFARIVDLGLPQLFSINTARSVDHAIMDEFFQQAVDASYLGKLPEGYSIHSANHPDSLARFDRGGVSHTKVRAVELEAIQLLLAPYPEHLEIDPANPMALAATKRLHTLIMYEDDPIHLNNIFEAMKKMSQDGRFKFKIKFVLRQTGITRISGYVADYLVFDAGQARSAEPFEIAAWEQPQRWIETLDVVRFQNFLSLHPLRSQRTQNSPIPGQSNTAIPSCDNLHSHDKKTSEPGNSNDQPSDGITQSPTNRKGERS